MDKQTKAPALTEGLNILELAVTSDDPITFENILKRTNMSRSSVDRLLKVLVSSGYLSAIPEKRGGYLPGLRTMTLAGNCLRNAKQLEQISNEIKRTAKTISASIQYALFDRDSMRITVLLKEEPEDCLHIAGPGSDITKYCHRHALGKTSLAFVTAEERKNLLLKCNAVKKTSTTLMPGKTLNSALKTIKEQGYCEDYGEHQEHFFRVGIPVFNREKIFHSAICAAWIAPSFDPEKATLIRNELSVLAEIISLTLIGTGK